ncbi:MAG: signal peptidase I [Actinomycetota bacterium]
MTFVSSRVGSDERTAGDPDPTGHDGPPPRSGFLRRLPRSVVLALLLAIVVRALVVQAFFIPSVSMVPTLHVGDRLLVNRLAYRVGELERFDVIVFSEPNPPPERDRGVVARAVHWLGEGIGLSGPGDEDFVKRVIALPGETWEIRAGAVYVQGEQLAEPYLEGPPDLRDFGPQTVPAGTVFVLGDNRLDSCDSRFPPDDAGECHGLGYVPVRNVIGQAFAIVWPPKDTGWLH